MLAIANLPGQTGLPGDKVENSWDWEADHKDVEAIESALFHNKKKNGLKPIRSCLASSAYRSINLNNRSVWEAAGWWVNYALDIKKSLRNFKCNICIKIVTKNLLQPPLPCSTIPFLPAIWYPSKAVRTVTHVHFTKSFKPN